MRRSIPFLVAAAGAATIAASAPAHIHLQTCDAIRTYNGQRHVSVNNIDLVNVSIDCHVAHAILRIYIEDGGQHDGWTCHASGIYRTSGSGRDSCKKGHQDIVFSWRIG